MDLPIFFECSAKTGQNVSRVFEEVVKQILRKIDSMQNQNS